MPSTSPDRPRPSKAELAAAADRTIDDVIAPGLAILFVGINPGLWSGATGFHFANPGNRFWRAIHLAGLVDRVLDPSDQRELLQSGIGIVNLVPRTTASAAELSRDELRAGGQALVRKLERYQPASVAFLGISTYKVAFDAPAIEIGPQPERLAGARVWVLPNPSGLNASWSLSRLAEAYGALREQTLRPERPPRPGR
jgi:TDG/mug DNA glycosylase family protein